MKHFILSLLVLSLAACGPSAKQAAATEEMAQAQTQAAAPTVTPTITPTATLVPTNTPLPTSTATASPTPTATPELVSMPKNGDIIPHKVSGTAPNGMPGSAVSEFFSSDALFHIHLQETKISYVLNLNRRKELPDGATLIVYFENPIDQSTAIVGTVDDPSLDSFFVQSIPLTGFKCRTYWIEVHIFSDSAMTNKVGVHLQWTRSSFDMGKITSPLDLVTPNCKY
jgi:hypothetical protein